jgi:succinoglycan biosynthesis protein ExoU
MTASDHSTQDKVAVDRAKCKGASACVDVLIAARDRADTIERAVQSALAQEEVRTVIVVDDGSTDDTAARALRCAPDGSRVIVRRLGSSAGPSAARNVALEISESPWIAILDGDDFFLPGRIKTLLALSTDWDFVADDPLQISEDRFGHETPTRMLSGACRQPRGIDFEEFVRGNVTRRGALRRELGFIKPLMRRSFLRRYGLRYDEALRLGEDYALYARALASGARFLLAPAAGYVSVMRLDSLSAQHNRQDLERFRDSDCELMALGTLSPKERRALAAHYSSVDCRVQWLAVIEAVKSRDYLRLFGTFLRSRPVARYIAMQLLEELHRRLRKAVVGFLRPI